MVELTFRTTDDTKWGAGKGSDLTKGELDNNFWELYVAFILQSHSGGSGSGGGSGVGIDHFTVTGNFFTVTLTDNSIQGPFPLPTSNWNWTGSWGPIHNYNPFDTFSAIDPITNQIGIYLVLLAHTSAATFNPADNDGFGHDFYTNLVEAITGPQGPQGLKGEAGNDGDDGVGFPGPPGPPGPVGPQGAAGTPGGPVGPPGAMGPAGDDGEDGLRGPPGIQGVQGIPGAIGSPGGTGATGAGVPVGGSAAQVLSKIDGTDYNTHWVTPSGGGGGSGNPLENTFTAPPAPGSWGHSDLNSIATTAQAGVGGNSSTQIIFAGNNASDASASLRNDISASGLGGASGWRATGRFRRWFPIANFVCLGLVLSDGTQIIAVGPGSWFGGAIFINSETATTFAGAGATQGSIQASMASALPPSEYWLRVHDDRTNRVWSLSFDGLTWVDLLSEARTTFLTPTQIGFGGFNHISIGSGWITTLSCVFECLSWVYEDLP